MLGKLFNRNIQITQTDTLTGVTDTFQIITPDNLMGSYPDWGAHAVLGIPAVDRSVTLISDLVGSFPWHAYSNYANRENQQVSSVLLDQPNPPDTRTTTFASLVVDYLIHGNAIGVYATRNAEGYPTSLVPVPADCVQVRLLDSRRVYKIGDQEYDQDDIFHAKALAGPGDLRGCSKLELHTKTFQLAKDQERAASGASNSGVPTGLLKSSNPDLTPDEARDLKTGWMNSQATRSIGVLNATTDFVPLAWNPSEAQLLDARKFSIHEIGLIFGIPLSFLGVEAQSMTYENGEQKGLDLLKFTLGGIVTRFEQELSKAHPRGTFVKANLDSLLRPDTLTRYTSHEIGLRSGWLKKSEVRELEDLPPIPGIDDEPQEDNNDQEVTNDDSDSD